MSAGLLREPPVSDDEDIKTLDETEIESRRQLAWAILGLDWCVFSLGIRRPSSLSHATANQTRALEILDIKYYHPNQRIQVSGFFNSQPRL
jgi:hypothetical protein